MVRERARVFWTALMAGMLLAGCVTHGSATHPHDMMRHQECMKGHKGAPDAATGEREPGQKCHMMTERSAPAVADPAGHTHGDESSSSGKVEQHE